LENRSPKQSLQDFFTNKYSQLVFLELFVWYGKLCGNFGDRSPFWEKEALEPSIQKALVLLTC